MQDVSRVIASKFAGLLEFLLLQSDWDSPTLQLRDLFAVK
jgi:hypothetical protein